MDLLLQLVKGEYKGNLPAGKTVRNWAAYELRERGITDAFKDVRNYLIQQSDVGNSIDEVRFCKERLDVLSQSATREEAYINALAQVGPR